MAFKNSKGVRVTYECSELIEELKNDIEEFGGDTLVYVWCKNALGVTLYVNYDFIDEDDPVRWIPADNDYECTSCVVGKRKHAWNGIKSEGS